MTYARARLLVHGALLIKVQGKIIERAHFFQGQRLLV